MGRRGAGWAGRAEWGPKTLPAYPAYPARPARSRAQRDARRVRWAWVAGRLVLMRRADERGKQRMRPGRLRLELGMELHREVPRMTGQLGDLHELSVRRSTGNAKPILGQRPLVPAIALVTVTMALVNQVRAIDALRERPRNELARVRA